MTVIITNPVERTRFAKFIVVGVVGAAVDFGAFNLLSTLLHFNAVFASIISFGAAVASNFIWNRYWIYPDSRSKSLRRQGAQFTLVNVIGLVIRTPIFALLEPFLGSEFQVMGAPKYGLNPNFLGHNMALAIAVIVVMLWNFFVNRYWTYNDVDAIEIDSVNVENSAVNVNDINIEV
jgi:putative flippase GtrA